MRKAWGSDALVVIFEVKRGPLALVVYDAV